MADASEVLERFPSSSLPPTVEMLVNWLYFCAIMMVNSGYLSLEKILPPQVVSSLLEGPKELGHPLTGRVDVA